MGAAAPQGLDFQSLISYFSFFEGGCAVGEVKLRWTPHPVLKIPTRENVLGMVERLGADEARRQLAEFHAKRERAIELEKSDPLRHGFEPETFKRARELLAERDQLLIMGGNREGKTVFAAKFAAEDLAMNPNRVWAFFHSSENSSIRQQQAIVHKMLPPEWRNIGKEGSSVYVKYTEATGFSNGQFILPNGSRGYFFNYKQDVSVLEGYELDGVWFDELVPLPFVESLSFRLSQERRLRMLLTFTPVTGYTPTVAKFIAGARVIESRRADLLSQDAVHVKDCPRGHMPYVMSCTGDNAAVLFFHVDMNPFGAGEKLRKELRDAPSGKIKLRAYGWAEKSMGSAFPKFCSTHLVTRKRFEELAKEGVSRYCVADPGGEKNWFIKWYAVTKSGWAIIYREWPDFQRYGEWALPPERVEKADWRAGPAQRLDAGRGIKDYKRLILELEGWRWDADLRKWDDSKAEKIEMRLIDPRMGGMTVPSEDEGTSIIDLMAEESVDRDGTLLVPGMDWDKAPASHIVESVQLLNDALDFDEARPVNVENCPKLYVADDLLQTQKAYMEFSGLGTQKDALKDIVDPDRYFIKAGLGFVEPEMFRARGGCYY